MKRLIRILLLCVLFVFAACTPNIRVFDPTALIGEWSRIEDSTSVVTITKSHIDIYSDGQYICEYSCMDFDPHYFTLYVNRLWLNDGDSYKRQFCASSISTNDSVLYIRGLELRQSEATEGHYYHPVVLIKM